jgi:uncharacterized protein DUF3332
MKRFVVLLMMATALAPSLGGCFGKFAVTRKVYELNASVHDRYLRNVVTWAFFFFPVYGVSGALDLFVFNTIEFWSGRNPVTAGERSFRYSRGDEQFNVRAVKNNDLITFTIDRYRGATYLDTLTISSDLATDSSSVVYRQPDGASTRAAKGIGYGSTGLYAGVLLPSHGAAAVATLYR